MRSKEESSDYRYFPDPDLVNVLTSRKEVDAVRKKLGRLPAETRALLKSDYELNDYDSDVIVNQGRGVVEYFLSVADGSGDAKLAGNWVQQHVLRTLNEQEIEIDAFSISADRLTGLLNALKDGSLDSSRAKEVFATMLENELSAPATMDKLGIVKVDTGELEQLCQALLDANPKVVEQYLAGKTKAIGALIGQAKKANSNVSPDDVRQTLIKLIEA